MMKMKNYDAEDNIYLYSNNLEQSKYKNVMKKFNDMSGQVGYDIVEASNDEIMPFKINE